jgi:hypothetical protein
VQSNACQPHVPRVYKRFTCMCQWRNSSSVTMLSNTRHVCCCLLFNLPARIGHQCIGATTATDQYQSFSDVAIGMWSNNYQPTILATTIRSLSLSLAHSHVHHQQGHILDSHSWPYATINAVGLLVASLPDVIKQRAIAAYVHQPNLQAQASKQAVD